MANYATLKAAIEDVIKTNGNNEITGAILQSALLAMINSLGADYQFVGVAAPDTDPGTPDQNVFYLAKTPGVYSNFNGLVVLDGEIAVFKWNGAWSKESTGAESRADFRPFGSMAGSVFGGYLIDRNMVFSGTELEYVPSNLYDTVWVNIMENSTQIVVSGATPFRFRFFSSLDSPTEETNISYNTTGDVPLGAKLVLIAFSHADNPGGYGSLAVSQDGWPKMVNDFFPRGLYYATNKVLNVVGSTSIKFQSNANFDCFIVFTQGASKIQISGLLGTQNYRFFDSANIFDGSEIVSHQVGRNTPGLVPMGAVVCVVSMRKTDYPNGHAGSILERTYGIERKKIRMLLIGNSATDDALSYVPFILQNMNVPVDFQIGIAMQSSSTLAMHVSNFENQTAAYSFRLYTGGSAWVNQNDKTLQWMLDNYTWDIISLQQAQPQKENTYQPYLNKLINYISGYVSNPIKFIWYQTHIYSALSNGGAPRGDQVIADYYASEVSACQNIVGASVCEYIVPVSTAIQNARSIPAIKALGDYADNENNDTGNGWLNYLDGVHLQEGLPCQIAAYTFILAILDIYGFKEFSINGETTRVTSAWTSGKNIPSPHGSPIGSTDANCLIAQKCAIMAMKHPFVVTDMNYIVDPS